MIMRNLLTFLELLELGLLTKLLRASDPHGGLHPLELLHVFLMIKCSPLGIQELGRAGRSPVHFILNIIISLQSLI